MMRFRRPACARLPEAERSAIAKEASEALSALEKKSGGQSALLLSDRPQRRPDADPLPRIIRRSESGGLQLANLRLSDYLEPATPISPSSNSDSMTRP